MRVPLSWLREFVQFEQTGDEIAEGLTQLGLEVEQLIRPGGQASGLIIGRLLAVERHPQADNLFICQVNIGQEQLTIVTGAKNVQPNTWVVVAPPGSRLPDGMELGARKLRGVLSQGMLCATWELGLPSSAKTEEEKLAEGILVLPDAPELQAGLDALPLLGLDDEVLELSLTPNYAVHCQSLYGVAREVGAWLQLPVQLPSLPVPSANNGAAKAPSAVTAAEMTSVAIEAPDLCSRYIARVVTGVQVGPSPLLIQQRLQLCGMRPINNVVDITNYVLLETGQPLHAFDLDKLSQQRIVVRRARSAEEILTLDGVQHQLAENDLVIADGQRAQAIAGIMGGADSEVEGATTSILLEAAAFDATSVFRTARRLGVRTEASIRFDKGVDPAGVMPASQRAADLIAALTGGQQATGAVDQGQMPPARRVAFRPQRLRRLLLPASNTGQEETSVPQLDNGAIMGFLQRLGFTPAPAEAAADAQTGAGQDQWLAVNVPSYRSDVTIEADLAEEVGRLLGYDQLPATLPVGGLQASGRSHQQRARHTVRRALTTAGFNEVVTWSFSAPQLAEQLQLTADHPQHRALAIANPMVSEQSRLRTTLLGGLLDAAAYNIRQGNQDLALFEVGTVYLPAQAGQLPTEQATLSLLARGDSQASHWQGAGAPWDFFAVKGALEHAAHRLGQTLTARAGEEPFLRPGQSAHLASAGLDVGWLGRLHPDVAARWDLPDDVIVAEIALTSWLEAGAHLARYEPLPRYPAVQRDISLLVNLDVTTARIVELIRAEAGQLLEEVNLFDVYTGDQVPAGKRSLAFALRYRWSEGTLTDAEVDEVHNKVRSALASQLGASLREG